jgi:3-isopropylmalate/(R)-2-methylmalate dehydratase small subunit
MQAKGLVHRYGDNVDTDVIIPARYLNTADPAELAKNCMEDIDKDFVNRVKDGDIMVAGKNFGCGSSREHAPIAIKASGISCVIAESFARIFYRNSINNGLLLIENSDIQDRIKEGDKLTVEPGKELVLNGEAFRIGSLPDNLMDILNDGGLVNAMKKRNGLI